MHSQDLRQDQGIQNLSILCVSETHISHQNNQHNIDGYSLYTKQTKHGLAMYVDNSFSVNVTNAPSCDACQVFALQLQSIQPPTVIAVLYRPPSGTISQFLAHLDSTIRFLKLQTSNLLLLGDFNIDIQSPAFQDILLQHCLTNIVNKPTHFYGRTLDLILSSFSTIEANSFPVPYTDHHIVWTTLPTY